MSSDETPITPARFAAALPSLPLVSLRLKCLELRNSMHHLAQSNQDLQPYADGRRTAIGSQAPGVPDQDCIDAIRENNLVMQRMAGRIELLRSEVERRGVGWSTFELGGADGAGDEELGELVRTRGLAGVAREDGDEEEEEERNPWADGTFQTGTIRNGQLHVDEVPGPSAAAPAAAATLSPAAHPTGEEGPGRSRAGDSQAGEPRRAAEGRGPPQAVDPNEEEPEEAGEGVYL